MRRNSAQSTVMDLASIFEEGKENKNSMVQLAEYKRK
jgi:hypothetical protein